MTSDYAELLERLEQCEMRLQAGQGYIKALEYGLRSVIASDPVPERLAAVWDHVLIEATEEHRRDAHSSPLCYAAFQHALSVISEQIRHAAPGSDANRFDVPRDH